MFVKNKKSAIIADGKECDILDRIL